MGAGGRRAPPVARCVESLDFDGETTARRADRPRAGRRRCELGAAEPPSKRRDGVEACRMQSGIFALQRAFSA